MSAVMTLSGPSKVGEPSKTASVSVSAKKTRAPAPAQTSPADEDDSDSDANSELEEQELAAAAKGKRKGKANGVKALEQRDLVALAFAGDNVVQVRPRRSRSLAEKH